MNNKLHVKTGDTVGVSDRKIQAKTKTIRQLPAPARCLEVSPKEGKVIVEGINVVTKHVKPRRMPARPAAWPKGRRPPLHACKVMLVCPKCGKPTRSGRTS